MLSIDDTLKEKINKQYIGYKNGFQNLVGINFYKFGLHITFVSLHKKDLKDYKDLVKNVPEERGWGKKSGIDIRNKEDLYYGKELIKEAYTKYNK